MFLSRHYTVVFIHRKLVNGSGCAARTAEGSSRWESPGRSPTMISNNDFEIFGEMVSLMLWIFNMEPFKWSTKCPRFRCLTIHLKVYANRTFFVRLLLNKESTLFHFPLLVFFYSGLTSLSDISEQDFEKLAHIVCDNIFQRYSKASVMNVWVCFMIETSTRSNQPKVLCFISRSYANTTLQSKSEVDCWNTFLGLS